VLLLLVFGAKRLPEMGRSLGSGMRGFKDAISGESEHPSMIAQQQEPTPMTTDAPALTPVVTSVGQTGTPAA
jgi:sec-independent protein translocase protein TatA